MRLIVFTFMVLLCSVCHQVLAPLWFIVPPPDGSQAPALHQVSVCTRPFCSPYLSLQEQIWKVCIYKEASVWLCMFSEAEHRSPYSIKQHPLVLALIKYLYSCQRSRPNEDFYRQFGSEILQRYGNASGSLPESAAEAFSAGIKPTFQQFITYLLDPETERERIFNEHWRQVWSTAGTFGLYRKSQRNPIKS